MGKGKELDFKKNLENQKLKRRRKDGKEENREK